ncbi:unnamed protein product, partial [Didymodactylos carnosus]
KRQVNGRISKDVHNLFYQSEKFNMKNYEDDAHDNTTLKNDENDDCFNGSPALYQERETIKEIKYLTTNGTRIYVNDHEYNVICDRYGNILLFYKYNNEYFAFIQRYQISKKRLSQFVLIPQQMTNKSDELYPLLTLTKTLIISIKNILYKCIPVPFEDVLYISEIRVDHEHA